VPGGSGRGGLENACRVRGLAPGLRHANQAPERPSGGARRPMGARSLLGRALLRRRRSSRNVRKGGVRRGPRKVIESPQAASGAARTLMHGGIRAEDGLIGVLAGRTPRLQRPALARAVWDGLQGRRDRRLSGRCRRSAVGRRATGRWWERRRQLPGAQRDGGLAEGSLEGPIAVEVGPRLGCPRIWLYPDFPTYVT